MRCCARRAGGMTLWARESGNVYTMYDGLAHVSPPTPVVRRAARAPPVSRRQRRESHQAEASWPHRDGQARMHSGSA